MMIRRALQLVVAASLLGLVGCAIKPKPLYHWESFPSQQYSTLLRTGISPDEQIRIMEAQVEKARVVNAALPPGFRAHLGMLYLGAGNSQRAKELWVAEKTAFPEASPYMDRLLNRLDGSAQSNKSGSPA